MQKKPKKSIRRPTPRKGTRGNGPLQLLVGQNTVSAIKDESYKIVVQVVDELLADPEIRDLIRRYTRDLFRAIARKI